LGTRADGPGRTPGPLSFLLTVLLTLEAWGSAFPRRTVRQCQVKTFLTRTQAYAPDSSRRVPIRIVGLPTPGIIARDARKELLP